MWEICHCQVSVMLYGKFDYNKEKPYIAFAFNSGIFFQDFLLNRSLERDFVYKVIFCCTFTALMSLEFDGFISIKSNRSHYIEVFYYYINSLTIASHEIYIYILCLLLDQAINWHLTFVESKTHLYIKLRATLPVMSKQGKIKLRSFKQRKTSASNMTQFFV